MLNLIYKQDYILLEILSYMTARELCQLSRVCRHWYWISSDNILWGRRLQKDMRSWKVIKHTTNPHMFLGCQPEWHNKEMFVAFIGWFLFIMQLRFKFFNFYLDGFLMRSQCFNTVIFFSNLDTLDVHLR